MSRRCLMIHAPPRAIYFFCRRICTYGCAPSLRGVSDDRNRAQCHRRARDHGIQEDAEGRIQSTGSHGHPDEVVQERQEEVLADIAHSTLAQQSSSRDAREFAWELRRFVRSIWLYRFQHPLLSRDNQRTAKLNDARYIAMPTSACVDAGTSLMPLRSSLANRGSSAMPQIGQLSGACRIGGCIGQVRVVLIGKSGRAAGRNAVEAVG